MKTQKGKQIVSLVLVVSMMIAWITTPVNASSTDSSQTIEDDLGEECVTVHYYNENGWDEPYIYSYNGDYEDATWPGEPMSYDGNGWYSYIITGTSFAKVIFSNKGENQYPEQNNEGLEVSGEEWYALGTWYEFEPEGITVHFYDYDGWDNINIYYYCNDKDNSWSGVPMRSEGDGWYEYTVFGFESIKVLFNDGGLIQIPGVMEEGLLASSDMWYRNGEWTDSRPDEIFAFFYMPSDWNTPYIYYYLNDDDTGPEWPGTQMEDAKELLGDGWYMYDITKYSAARVMFTDGVDQTPGRYEEGFYAETALFYKEGICCDLDSDVDGDGLEDYIELVIGSDVMKMDTDSDGLPDGYEFFSLYTDPTLADTYGDGKEDGDEDFDEDGITNLEEYALGTDPFCSDSDGDSLSDYEEIYVYFTDPVLWDTDGDTLSDGDDIALGFSPILQDTDGNGTLDCDEIVEQELSSDRICENLMEDNVLTLKSLNLFSSGNVNGSMRVDEYTGCLKGDEREYVGKAIEITGDSFEHGEITFGVSDDYEVKVYSTSEGRETSGLLICYNDGETTVPLETYYDVDTRTLRADIYQTGIYFVFDFMQWMETWGIEAIDDSGDGEISFCSIESTDIANVAVKGQADIIFVVDTTGSMGTAISNVKNNIMNFVDSLSVANVSASFALVEYRDITCDGQYYTNVKKNGNSNWYTDAEDFKEVISSLSVGGGGDTDETPIDALEMARELDIRDSAQKFIILITDAGYKINNNYGISSMDEMAQLLSEDGINVSVVSTPQCMYVYENLYESTGGLFANIYGDFSTALLEISEKINEETNDGYWIALNGLLPRIVRLDEKPTSTGSADTDGDGLLDREELKNVEPTRVIDVYGFYKALMGGELDGGLLSISSIGVYDYYSDPTKKDTDGDGISDDMDARPRSNDVKYYELDSDYISVVNYPGYDDKGSYGGNQGWFCSDKECSIWNEDCRIKNYGCGLIAVTDTLLYMLSRNGKFIDTTWTAYMNSNGEMDYSDYYDIVHDFNFNINVVPKLGLNGLAMANFFNGFSFLNGMGVYAKWGTGEVSIDSILKMLNDDIPVVLSVWTGSNDDSDKVAGYRQVKFSIKGWENDKNDVVYIEDHYVTVTGVVYDGDDIWLEVSSWGELYYINFQELCEKVYGNDSNVLTEKIDNVFNNILVIG